MCGYTYDYSRIIGWHTAVEWLCSGLYSYGLYSYGFYSYGLYSYGLHSYGLHSYGLHSYGLHSYGPYSYGLCSCSHTAVEWVCSVSSSTRPSLLLPRGTAPRTLRCRWHRRRKKRGGTPMLGGSALRDSQKHFAHLIRLGAGSTSAVYAFRFRPSSCMSSPIRRHAARPAPRRCSRLPSLLRTTFLSFSIVSRTL